MSEVWDKCQMHERASSSALRQLRWLSESQRTKQWGDGQREQNRKRKPPFEPTVFTPSQVQGEGDIAPLARSPPGPYPGGGR